MNWQRVLQNASNFIIWCLNQYYWTRIFCFCTKSFLCRFVAKKPVSKVMKTVIDFLKILPDTAPFPNFFGEKISITKAYIKKIKSIDG
jgi:hypothetical protein